LVAHSPSPEPGICDGLMLIIFFVYEPDISL